MNIIKCLYYHLFYRTYWWNTIIIREKDLPIFASFIFLSGILGLNVMAIIGAILDFIFKDPEAFPDWGHWPIMLLVIVNNYFIFINKKKYKSIIQESEKLDKREKRKNDIIIIVYLILTFLLVFYISNESANILNYNKMYK